MPCVRSKKQKVFYYSLKYVTFFLPILIFFLHEELFSTLLFHVSEILYGDTHIADSWELIVSYMHLQNILYYLIM